MKGYTTREVAEVVGLSTSKILSWTRSGLLTPQRGPRGAYLFSFQDIVLLRTARDLLTQDVPARRVREALEALREQLPVGRPLSAVHVSAVGDRILVQDDDAVWEPSSGQLQLDFDAADVAETAAPVARRALEARANQDSMRADDWFNTALDLEAYQAALRLDPDLAVAHFNLSRLFEAEGRRPDALRHLAEYKRLIERGGLGA